MQPKSLDEVITCLDGIIQNCSQQSSRMGYFACLYRKMTVAIKDAINKGAFEDGARMAKLDVFFANRYLDAYKQYVAGQKPTASWQTAFDAGATDKLTVLQHLLLGINAHINLDLGIAAAKVSTPETIGQLAKDFNKVNEVIGTLFRAVQTSLSRIAFPMYFIKKINPERTDAVLNFSISKARQTAWGNALLLSEIGEGGEQQVIATTDQIVYTVAQGIQSPGKLNQSDSNSYKRSTKKKQIIDKYTHLCKNLYHGTRYHFSNLQYYCHDRLVAADYCLSFFTGNR